MSARENLFGFVEAGAQEEDLPTFAAAIDAFRAEVSAEGLTVVERAFLNFALGLAADVMASCGDEFGAEDEAALASFRHMAAPAPVESAGDETGEAEVEYGVRVSDETVMDPTWSRTEADRRLAHYSAIGSARLVTREVRYGAWVEVAS